MKKTGEILETIAIYVALISLIPVLIWWHKGTFAQQRPYLFYLFLILCVMGYVTYRRIKRIRAAFKAQKKHGSGPPFFG